MARLSTKAVAWTIIATGLLVPWFTGIGVKLYLDARDQPTLDWSSFLDPVSLLFLIPSAVYWAAPFIVLALVARRVLNGASLAQKTRLIQLVLASLGLVDAASSFLFGAGGFAITGLTFVVCGLMSWPIFILHSYQARLLFLVGGLVGGSIGAVQTFAEAWTDMEGIFFGFFVLPFAYFAKMTVGLLIGYAAGKALDLAYKHEV